jgi:tRNA uridine 5-carboxymethylaminomethyl modification enzyme
LINDQAWADFQAKQTRAQKLAAMLEKTRVSGELLEKIERAQQERLAVAADDSEESDGTSAAAPQASVSKLPSAVGTSLAQLLRRPEIVIEDFASVVREGYPEFFVEIAGQNLPLRHGDTEETGAVGNSALRPYSDHDSQVTGHDFSRAENDLTESGFSPCHLSAAARNEMKTVETEIKYSGYLDQQRKSIERLKKSEQRVIPGWFDYGKVSGLSREMNEKLQRVRPRTLGHASRIPGVTPAAVSLINVYIEIQGKRFTHTEQTTA